MLNTCSTLSSFKIFNMRETIFFIQERIFSACLFSHHFETLKPFPSIVSHMVAVMMMPSVSKQNPFFPTCSQRLTATRQPQFWSSFSNNNKKRKELESFCKSFFPLWKSKNIINCPSFFPSSLLMNKERQLQKSSWRFFCRHEQTKTTLKALLLNPWRKTHQEILIKYFILKKDVHSLLS